MGPQFVISHQNPNVHSEPRINDQQRTRAMPV